jgi:hypothetical protein
MKIDIEGAEHIMLAGAIKTITKYKPVIYIEIHSEYCAIVCYEIFSDLNYDISVIHEEEDNRLMIKASFNNKHKSKSGDSRVIENFNNRLQNENIRLQDNQKRMQSQLNELNDENEQMQSQLKKLNDENQQMQLKYQRLENCKAVRYGNKIKKYARKIGIKI